MPPVGLKPPFIRRLDQDQIEECQARIIQFEVLTLRAGSAWGLVLCNPGEAEEQRLARVAEVPYTRESRAVAG